MQSAVENTAVTAKIQELCQAILDEPWFKSVQERMDAFRADEDAQRRFQAVSDRGELLRHKQSQGLAITPAEVGEFEKLRDEFFSSAVARGFVEAQEEVQQMKSTVERHVGMTLELGRLPREEDLQGGCGSGCGCSH